MNENFSKQKLFQGMIFTLLITFATGLGNVLSEFFMLDVKKQEAEDNLHADARRQATELHCTKLQESASLATEIMFRADRGYPNVVTLERGFLMKKLKKNRKIWNIRCLNCFHIFCLMKHK